MKLFFYPLAWLLSITNIFAQRSTGTLTLFDKNWEETNNEKKAKFFLHKYRMDDTTWLFDYYNFIGPKIRQESYRDEAGKKPNGFYTYYNENGLLDSCGNIFSNVKSGSWMYFKGETWKDLSYKTFYNGVLVKDETGPDTSIINADVEQESSFPGGQTGWQRFLIKNLRYPNRAMDLRMSGSVSVMFIVDQNGKINDPLLAKSVEYSLDEEILRLISISPNWVPAMHNGKNVRSYKKQPVKFNFAKG